MKGVSPLISTVIVISIMITSIGAVLLIANPQINRAKIGMTINEAKENMKIIDDTIRQVASEGTGALRSLTLKTSDGGFIVRNSTGIEYILDTDFNYVPVRAVIKDGNIRTSSGMSALGLIGYWRFDEGGGTIANDSSGKGHDGQVYVYNTTFTNWTVGKYGSALDFDGINDYVQANFTLPTNSLTIVLWVKPRDIRGFGYPRFAHPIGLGGNTVTIYLHQGDYEADPGGPFAYKFNYSGQKAEDDIGIHISNQWQHLAVTFDGSNTKGYFNGVLNQTTIGESSSPIVYSDNNVTIGNLNMISKTNFFNGTIDEVKIYNRVLNSTEIQDDYNLPPNKLKISLDYDNIIIKGTSRWGKGTTKICIEKLGTQSNKALVEVRTC